MGGDGWFVSMEDGLDVSRQNGKGVILQVLEGYFAFELGYDLVTHTAHEFKTCREHMHRLMAFVQNAPGLHARVKDRGYMTGNGNEAILLRTGGRIMFHARSKSSGRGFSGDLLVWDEAMVIPEFVVGAQMPNLRASDAPHGPKIVYAGSAVDQEIMEYGISFARIRERGIAQAPDVSWHEWSAPFDHPSEMTKDLLGNRKLWHAANPSIEEGLIREEHMAREIEAMAARTAAVELLGVGDWPRTDGMEDTAISIEAWDALEDPDSVLQLDEGWALTFDVSPERWCSIAFSGLNQDGKFHTEIQKHAQGTSWVPDWIENAVEKGNPDMVACDGVGPAASLVPLLEAKGIKVQVVNTQEHGQACGRLVDMVEEDGLAHLGSEELRDAIRGAKQRPLGDAWAWSRKNSSVDISPLVASTLGLGVVAGVVGNVELAIF